MDKFAAVVMEIVNSGCPQETLPATRKSIALRLLREVARSRLPDHPPYSAMIHRAIQELNKKGGSTEDEISKFIENAYVTLPWGHSTLLKHHLGNLCDNGEIVVTSNQCYLLPDSNHCLSSGNKSRRQKAKRIRVSKLPNEKCKQHKKGE